MKKNFAVRVMLALIATVLSCLAATSCDRAMTDEEKASWNAVEALSGTLKENPLGGPTVFLTSPMAGGMAIVMYAQPVDNARDIEVYYVFWVHEKRVYWVNSTASTRYPMLPKSPSAVDLNTVLSNAAVEADVVFGGSGRSPQ